MYSFRRNKPLPKWVRGIDLPPLAEPIVPTPYDQWGRMFEPHRLGEGDHGQWHRLMVLDRPRGPWRRSDRAAINDALELGLATESKRYGLIFLDAIAWVAWLDLKNGYARGQL